MGKENPKGHYGDAKRRVALLDLRELQEGKRDGFSCASGGMRDTDGTSEGGSACHQVLCAVGDGRHRQIGSCDDYVVGDVKETPLPPVVHPEALNIVARRRDVVLFECVDGDHSGLIMGAMRATTPRRRRLFIEDLVKSEEGREYEPTDSSLVERLVKHPPVRGRRRPRWSHVGHAFSVGSTTAAALCTRFGLDPDEVLGDDSYEEEEDED